MAEVVQLTEVMRALLGHLQGGGAGGGGSGGGGGGGDKKKEVLYGKGFEMMDKFSGGETEWNEWSGDCRTMVQTKSEMAGEAMMYVKSVGKTEKEVLGWVDVIKEIKEKEDDFDQDDVVERFKDLGKVSKELYRWLRLKTEGEAKLLVLSEEEEGDGIKM